MTQSIASLGALLRIGKGEDELQAFAAHWANERLVMDKWFALQVACSDPAHTVATALKLTHHPDFDRKNPNRFRAVMGSLMSHQSGFHTTTGAGYKLLADELIALDPINPQTTARMTTAFQTLSRWDDHRQALMRAELGRIANTPGLSRDTAEMVTRILG